MYLVYKIILLCVRIHSTVCDSPTNKRLINVEIIANVTPKITDLITIFCMSSALFFSTN